MGLSPSPHLRDLILRHHHGHGSSLISQPPPKISKSAGGSGSNGDDDVCQLECLWAGKFKERRHMTCGAILLVFALLSSSRSLLPLVPSPRAPPPSLLRDPTPRRCSPAPPQIPLLLQPDAAAAPQHLFPLASQRMGTRTDEERSPAG
ncbi:hypothetical protein U9M48_037951 [Paspalum notatum var. saurae]|uniref:Uncharacterized protein n=1 Tax=Paspalum notatum var. saurae TaxID=547442 RepID=A0AAQ3XAM1_PASNO